MVGDRDLLVCPQKGSPFLTKGSRMQGLGGEQGGFQEVVPGLTLCSLSVTSVCVTTSMTVTVSMFSFHMPHKFLHHKKGDNSTKDPQSHRQNGALAWEWRQ